MNNAELLTGQTIRYYMMDGRLRYYLTTDYTLLEIIQNMLLIVPPQTKTFYINSQPHTFNDTEIDMMQNRYITHYTSIAFNKFYNEIKGVYLREPSLEEVNKIVNDGIRSKFE